MNNMNLETLVPFENSTRFKVKKKKNNNLEFDLFCEKILRNFFKKERS